MELLLRDDDVTFRVEARARRLAVGLEFVEFASRNVDLRLRLVDLGGGRRVRGLLLRQDLCSNNEWSASLIPVHMKVVTSWEFVTHLCSQ